MELKVNVPTRMQDITLEQYQKFLKECTDEKLSEETIAIKMLEIFCGLPEDHSLQLKMSDVFNICEKINIALNEKPNLIARWKFKEIEFGFIPQLDDMTFGEYVDVDTYITDWETMHRAMAVLYRPVLQNYKGSYEIDEYKGDTYWEVMKRMPLNLVMGCMLFFWNLERDLVLVMRNSLKSQKNPISQEKLTSMLSTVGITPYGDLQTKTSQK
jgi:hypothetical protein